MALCEETLRMRTHLCVEKHVVGRDASYEDTYLCGKTRCGERRFMWRDAPCGETLHVERRFVRGTVSYVL